MPKKFQVSFKCQDVGKQGKYVPKKSAFFLLFGGPQIEAAARDCFPTGAFAFLCGAGGGDQSEALSQVTLLAGALPL